MRHTLPIDASWTLSFRDRSANQYITSIPAEVPGNIVWDLHRAGFMPDPYLAENFRSCEWAEDEAFTYRCTLRRPPEASGESRAVLVFDGVDTFAEVRLNGRTLGRCENMMRTHRFEVPKELMVEEEWIVEVEILPPLPSSRSWIEKNRIDLSKTEGAFGIDERPAMRKMQMSFGWDNCPYLLAGGLFRSPRIEIIEGCSIKDHTWRVLRADEDRAEIEWTLQMDRKEADQPAFAEIKMDRKGKVTTAKSAVQGNACTLKMVIDQPDLWWPRGLGEAALYDYTLTLLTSEMATLDQRQGRAGIRTVELDTSVIETRTVDYRLGTHEPDEDEQMDGGFIPSWSRIPLKEPETVEIQRFQFRINGRDVFIRGANWQTPDIFPGRISPERYRRQVNLAVEANLNLLRLWGGGITEDDYFYEYCSEQGIMVWQDFHFACARYPQEETFLQEVREEFGDIIRRLRNHTSLAVWCGDNEHDMVDVDRGFDPDKNPINKGILPDVLEELDAQNRPYHPSSPSGGPYPRSEWAGDRRNWGAWYPHRDYEHIRYDQSRFVSEGGSYALPSLDLCKKAIPESVRWPLSSRTWRLHGGDVDRMARGFEEVNEQCWRFFEMPEDLESAVEISQFAQAWGYKRLVEHCRRRKGESGGVVLWKLNDCWPAVDAGLIDSEDQPRIAFEFVQNAFEPVSVSIESTAEERDGLCRLWLHNDGAAAAKGPLRWRQTSLQKSNPHERDWNEFEAECLPNRAVCLPVDIHLGDHQLLEVEWRPDDRPRRSWFCFRPNDALRHFRQPSSENR